MNKTGQIVDVQSLIDFLERKGKNHLYYYHYTNWKSLGYILNDHTFLLTRGNATFINDQHEATMKGSYDMWMKTYIGSFAFGSSENMAMWGLYGLPKTDAVRISIPRAKMIAWLHSIDSVSLWINDKRDRRVQGCQSSLTDVIYISGTERNAVLTHGDSNWSVNNVPGLRNVSRKPEMTGYIKNYAWHYENEVRLRIVLPQESGAERICIEIPSDVVDSMIITTGPNFEPKYQDQLYLSLMNKRRITESSFSGLIKYRTICDLCKHDSFVPKK